MIKGNSKRPQLVAYTVTSLLFALCFSVHAEQPAKIPIVGYFSVVPRSANPDRIAAFRDGLRQLGYVEGKNIVIEWRSAENNQDLLPALAAELVHLKVDLIVTEGLARDPCCQGSNFYDSHRHGIGSRSGWEWLCSQFGATGRECYWSVSAFAGLERKTIGDSEGDRS